MELMKERINIQKGHVKLIIHEYIEKEKNLILTEIEMRIKEEIIDRRLQIIDMNTGTRGKYIDDVWDKIYTWEEIKK